MGSSVTQGPAPKVSVIIPVYGVEKWVGRCTHSLMQQTLDDVEYIFIDDCSPDRSMDIVRETAAQYPHRQGQVRYLRHAQNRGLPAARNTGLDAARGEYVFHCDSDDYTDPDMLGRMYAAAIGADADMVWCDWYLTFGHSERYMRQPRWDTPMQALKSMLGGGMKYNVWNKLARLDIYRRHDIRFPEGYGMGEDLTMLLVAAYSQKVAYVQAAFYHYVKLNTDAFSHHTVSDSHYASLMHNVDTVCSRLEHICPGMLEAEMAYLKLEAKFPLIAVSGKWASYRKWQRLYPEANRYIRGNRNVSLRSRLVQMCARYRLYWLVWLHYQLVCRLIYGVIYR